MVILVLDDDIHKRSGIVDYLYEIYPEADFVEFSYRNKAVKYLRDNEEDMKENPDKYLLILDMQFPVLADTFPEADEGVHFLYYLLHKGYEIKVICCSSEDTMKEKCEEIGYPNLAGFIKYDSSVWMLPQFNEILGVGNN